MDLENIRPGIEVRKAELDLAIQSAGTKQRRVESVRSIGGHQHLDVSAWVETVELRDDLEHGALHLVITPCTIIEACSTHGVHLIDENDGRLLTACHLEDLTHHAGTLADVLLHQLTPNHPNEAGVRPIGDSTSSQGLACARRSIQKNTLRWVDAQVDEALWMQ